MIVKTVVLLAIGSPLGLQNSVTVGVVSGLHRSLGANMADLMQTDAPISPGNSGGALVDTRGQVVGLNEAHVPPQAGARPGDPRGPALTKGSLHTHEGIPRTKQEAGSHAGYGCREVRTFLSCRCGA
jgi:S1-C subfamily serine protease